MYSLSKAPWAKDSKSKSEECIWPSALALASLSTLTWSATLSYVTAYLSLGTARVITDAQVSHTHSPPTSAFTEGQHTARRYQSI